MAHISWSEVRDRAIRFSREWAGTSSESAEKQTFWNEFFEVFGLRRRSVATFEEPVQRIHGTYGKIDLFWPSLVLVEHKSLGEDLGVATSQAFSYIRDLTREVRTDEIFIVLIVLCSTEHCGRFCNV
jgi:restriction-modification enzyme MmeI-like protein